MIMNDSKKYATFYKRYDIYGPNRKPLDTDVVEYEYEWYAENITRCMTNLNCEVFNGINPFQITLDDFIG